MNKTELVSSIAENSGLTKKDSEKAVNAFIETVMQTVKSGDKIQIVGFGTFELRHRCEKVGRDPRTGKSINIAACNVPAFKAGKSFKDVVNS